MADTVRSTDDLLNASTGLFKDNTTGDISAQDLRDFVLSTYRPQAFCQGRLTLTSGTPVTTSDVTAATNVYWTPYNGNLVGLYDGTSWKLHTFTELTLALGTLTSDKNYDVFLYDNSGTLTLESLAWTNDTTRATALTTQDGVYVKTGATTRRYLGTFRTTSTTTTEDSRSRRFVWNLSHRVPRRLYTTNSTDSWSYTTATWRASNGITTVGTTRVEAVFGLDGCEVSATVYDMPSNNTTTGVGNGVGVDSTSSPSSQLFGGVANINVGVALSFYRGSPGLGYHYFQHLEYSTAAGTTTWRGDSGNPTFQQWGLIAEGEF